MYKGENGLILESMNDTGVHQGHKFEHCNVQVPLESQL